MDRRDNPLGGLRVVDRRMVGPVDRRMVDQVEEHHPQVAQVGALVVEDQVGREAVHLGRYADYMGE